MHSFEGEFRRKPQQFLGGASRNLPRDELVRRAQEERQQREEKRRVIHAATTIQAFIRGSFSRQFSKQVFRSEFDAFFSNPARNLDLQQLLELISKLLLFYNEKIDSKRLVLLNQCVLKDSENLSRLYFTDHNRFCYKLLKLLMINVSYLKSCVHPGTNIALMLRFIEVFTSFDNLPFIHDIDPNFYCGVMEKLWEFIIRKHYFSTLRLVLDTNVPDSLFVTHRPPTPLAASLLDLFLRPLTLNSEKKSLFLRRLIQDVFFQDLSPQVMCFLLPAFAHKSNVMTVDSVLTAIYPNNFEFSVGATPSLLYCFIYLINKQAKNMIVQQVSEYLECVRVLLQSVPTWMGKLSNNPIETDSDEEEIADETKSDLVSDTVAMINEIDHVNMIMGVVENPKIFGQCVVPICTLCNVLLSQHKLAIHHYRLLYTLAFKPSFFRVLWQSIVHASSPSIFGTTSYLLQIINQGMSFSPDDQELFLPQITVFCSLLNHTLSTLHDFEFYNQPSRDSNINVMPFALVELASISATLKDVCMGLIELAYPEKKSTFNLDYDYNAKMKRDQLNVGQWNQLFKVVVMLLRQLYSRDCRKKFCPDGTWIAKQFPIFFDRAAEMYFTKRRSGYGYEPFIGLQKYTREKLEEEGPPPSASEARQLSILREFPFAIKFHDRFKVFQSLIRKDKSDNQGELVAFQMGPIIRVTIRRNFIYEDASTFLSAQSEPNIKMRILVQLVNAVGVDEAGIDGGGLFREFLHELLKTCFDPNRGFFKTTHDGLLYPNPNVQRVVPDFGRHYYFVGRMLGKAMYENMLVELPLATFFLMKILSRHSSSDVDIHHLASLDPVMYRNLLYLKTYDGNVTDLGLDFTVLNSEFGENEVVELKSGGANIPVTENNRINYIHLMADYKLNRQIKAQCQAFKEGLANVLDMEWLYMFDPNELQVLISGSKTPIDVQDWKFNTIYAGGYRQDHPTIASFWKVVEGFDEQQQRQLLKFVTSCSHAPLLGFKELCPMFCIQNAGRDDRLPTASTCMNLLKLPNFESEEVLKSKLVYAIESGAGFELS